MILRRNDVSPEEGLHKYGSVEFADPINKKYPIDSPEHIRAAWSYLHMTRDYKKYSKQDLNTIKGRIIRAWKTKIDKKGPPASKNTIYELANL
ncbi:MAG: hypothetical protein PHC64_09965 [Candidatus Gastranaerophilales bacterium]|nr:hypothetical protein [Candidatus Gastranaerophilales bacterium]